MFVHLPSPEQLIVSGLHIGAPAARNEAVRGGQWSICGLVEGIHDLCTREQHTNIIEHLGHSVFGSRTLIYRQLRSD